MAPLKRPVSSPGMSADVLPSETMARTPGWRFSRAEQEAGEQPACRRAEDAEAHVTGDVTVDGGHVGGDVVHLAQDPPGPIDDPDAVLGEPALGAVDEGRAELPLEAGDVAGDVGLHREQRPRRRRERPVVGDRHERGQLADVHLPER